MRDKLFLWLALFLGLTACSDPALLDQNTAVKNARWSNKQEAKLHVNVKDTRIPYHFYFNVRNSTKYPFSNISVLIHQENPDNSRRTYRVRFRVADREGLWLGNGVGNIFTHQVRFLKSYHFPDTGTYSFHIEHNMTLDPLPGISDIGLRILPSNLPPGR